MWEHKTYTGNDFDAVMEMGLENYGPENDVSDAGFIRHQYFENPVGDALVELAVDPNNNVLAGQYVALPRKFRFFGTEIQSILGCNVLTREAYRRQKIFVKLTERICQRAAKEGFAFLYGAPNKNSYPGYMKKFTTFKDLHHFPLYARPLNPAQMVRERIDNKVLAAVARPFGVFFPNRAVNADGIEELTLNNVGRMDAFWEKIKSKYPIIGVRDAAYIRYRYLNVPKRIYYPYIAVENGEPVAFAVGRIREVAGFQCGMIADFLFLPGHEETAKRLVKTLVYRMKREGASLAGCIILSHTAEAKLLKRCGFWHIPEKILPQPTPLILRVLDEKQDESKLCDINNWFFTTGDYDVV